MIQNSKLGNYETILTVFGVVFIAYYSTGLYKNILEIKKLKKNGQ